MFTELSLQSNKNPSGNELPRVETTPLPRNNVKTTVSIRFRGIQTQPKISGSERPVNPPLVSRSQNPQSKGPVNHPRPQGQPGSAQTSSEDVYTPNHPNNVFWDGSQI